MKQFIQSLFLGCGLLYLSSPGAFAQDYFAHEKPGWLSKAEENKPAISYKTISPSGLVNIVKDETAFQGWKSVPGQPLDSLYKTSFKNKSGVVVDFGNHLTGYFSFSVGAIRGVPDAPLRFKLSFGEVPAEVMTPFDPYNGSLSRAWLQDEIIHVTELPATITVQRRLSFRYVKIELLGSSPYFDFGIHHLECKAGSSVTTEVAPLLPTADPRIAAIDKVGLNTLKECMQTVYEDGPKRDRRLWIGDLYLESISNAYSFQNNQLTKRCFYLLAGLTDKDGFLPSNVFETPKPHPQTGAPFLFEYSLHFNSSLKEYLVSSGDTQTARELWPVAKRQLDNINKYLLPNGLFDNEAAAANRWWIFVDWKENLDRQASLQGIIIFSLKQTYELARLLGKEKELSGVPALIKKMTAAARIQLFDKQRNLFVSGKQQQVSYASQAWMVLAGVVNEKESKQVFQALGQEKEVVRPGSPYLYHYYIEAMIKAGMGAEAKKALLDYWGGMVQKGADTFWEVYDPANDFLSPYNFYPINSYCHAWSCTPVYFIRKYPAIFQQ